VRYTASQVHFKSHFKSQLRVARTTAAKTVPPHTTYPQRPNIHVFERDGRTRRLARLDAPRHGTSPCDAGL